MLMMCWYKKVVVDQKEIQASLDCLDAMDHLV